jgi:hypothetical protein
MWQNTVTPQPVDQSRHFCTDWLLGVVLKSVYMYDIRTGLVYWVILALVRPARLWSRPLSPLFGAAQIGNYLSWKSDLQQEMMTYITIVILKIWRRTICRVAILETSGLLFTFKCLWKCGVSIEKRYLLLERNLDIVIRNDDIYIPILTKSM